MTRALAGRVLLVSIAGRILLVGSVNPVEGWPTVWVAPGGTAEPGETTLDAATRELFEETGLRVRPAELVGPVGVCHRPGRDVEYYYLPVSDDFIPTGQNPDSAELAVWVGFRWWTVEELVATRDTVWPVELADVLASRHELPHLREPWNFIPGE